MVTDIQRRTVSINTQYLSKKSRRAALALFIITISVLLCSCREAREYGVLLDIKQRDENISLYNLKIKSFYAFTQSENNGRVRVLAHASAGNDALSYTAAYKITYDERGGIIDFKRISSYLNPRAERSAISTEPPQDGKLLAYIMDIFTDFMDKFKDTH